MILLSLIASALAGDPNFCEVVDGENTAFMRNSYVEMGLGAEGAFGEGGAPAGWHVRANTGQLGFVANPQDNGWASFYGDFFAPGSPLEGWGLKIDGISYVNFNGGGDIAGALATPECDVTVCRQNSSAVTWTGEVAGVGIEQQYAIADGGVYIIMTTTLTNNTLTDINNLYWFRNVDPDNSQPTTGDYSTTNSIESQPNETTDLASVKAVGADGATLYLIASDQKARVTHGGFYNTDAEAIWLGAGFFSAVGSSASDDAAISLSVKIDTLAAGQSVSFRSIYALSPTAIAAATECAEAPVVVVDTDGDGVEDSVDVCAGFDDRVDTDGDLTPDGCDLCPADINNDSDLDGSCDSLDLCIGDDQTGDSDSDLDCDNIDTCPLDSENDADNDSVCGNIDICPDGDDLADTDLDLSPDACDTCPLDLNNDIDLDGICGDTDVCPTDSLNDTDNDSVCDSSDICIGGDDYTDTDIDTTPDFCDICPLDPLDDQDVDLLCANEDPCPLDVLNDSDFDTVCDIDDQCAGDDLTGDQDNDGVCSNIDYICPNDSTNDQDGDGICGLVDNCPIDSNDTQEDIDQDLIGDVCDPFDDRVFVDTGSVDTGLSTVTQTTTATATQTQTQTSVDTNTVTQTDTSTQTDTGTSIVTQTQTSTATETVTQTETSTQTVTETSTATATQTQTNTSTNIDTGTSVDTGAIDTGSATQTGTSINTETNTETTVEEPKKTKKYFGGWGCTTTGNPISLLPIMLAMTFVVLRNNKKLLLLPLLIGLIPFNNAHAEDLTIYSENGIGLYNNIDTVGKENGFFEFNPSIKYQPVSYLYGDDVFVPFDTLAVGQINAGYRFGPLYLVAGSSMQSKDFGTYSLNDVAMGPAFVLNTEKFDLVLKSLVVSPLIENERTSALLSLSTMYELKKLKVGYSINTEIRNAREIYDLNLSSNINNNMFISYNNISIEGSVRTYNLFQDNIPQLGLGWTKDFKSVKIHPYIMTGIGNTVGTPKLNGGISVVYDITKKTKQQIKLAELEKNIIETNKSFVETVKELDTVSQKLIVSEEKVKQLEEQIAQKEAKPKFVSSLSPDEQKSLEDLAKLLKKSKILQLKIEAKYDCKDKISEQYILKSSEDYKQFLIHNDVPEENIQRVNTCITPKNGVKKVKIDLTVLQVKQ